MTQTLLLNASYEPLKIIHWQRAITLWARGRVEIIAEHDREIRSITFSMKLPSIVRLLRYVKIKRREVVPFSRMNIYARDKHTCQYCGEAFRAEDLTFDHVIPVTQGGQRTWTNIVTCCLDCNREKGGRTPEEAGMRLLSHPKRPESAPTLHMTIGLRKTPDEWRNYLYWNIALDDEAEA
jgi:5-methylcytosine-specific restriction endonuclease McrA